LRLCGNIEKFQDRWRSSCSSGWDEWSVTLPDATEKIIATLMRAYYYYAPRR
jgi:hypothetical protein